MILGVHVVLVTKILDITSSDAIIMILSDNHWLPIFLAN